MHYVMLATANSGAGDYKHSGGQVFYQYSGPMHFKRKAE